MNDGNSMVEVAKVVMEAQMSEKVEVVAVVV
jgi:hypothetical protein